MKRLSCLAKMGMKLHPLSCDVHVLLGATSLVQWPQAYFL